MNAFINYGQAETERPHIHLFEPESSGSQNHLKKQLALKVPPSRYRLHKDIHSVNDAEIRVHSSAHYHLSGCGHRRNQEPQHITKGKFLIIKNETH